MKMKANNEKEQFVIDNYEHMTYKEMGQKLDLSRGSIQYIMNKYGLKKTRYSVQDYRLRTGEMEDFLRDWQSQFDSIEDKSKDDIISLVDKFKVQLNEVLEN